ncbi:E3 ubiquitin-protein ligase hrd1, partial [Spiromyces aspiralis]
MPDNNQLPNRNNNRRQQATFRSGIPRLPLYGAITTALTCTVIASTVSKYPHYYTAMLYLAKSNTSMLVLANMSLLLIILFCKLMFRLFFGTLRAIEVEHLYERGWFSVTEMCLALTIFRDESNILMAEMFAALLVVKIFHWLLEDRVDFMEQQLMLS